MVTNAIVCILMNEMKWNERKKNGSHVQTVEVSRSREPHICHLSMLLPKNIENFWRISLSLSLSLHQFGFGVQIIQTA